MIHLLCFTLFNSGFGSELLNSNANESATLISNLSNSSVLCDINHCLNNGTCIKNEFQGQSEISCICMSDFHGAQCQCRNDLCTTNAHNCGSELKCLSLCNYFACYCPREGYTADLMTKKCVDIDECAILDVCRQPNEVCINLPGSYSCDCESGYVKNRITNQCIDIDECQLPNVCGLHGICKNVPGTFHCSCEPGFEGIPCEDYDECARQMPACEQICVNTIGSYNCSCFEDFTMENETCVYTGNESCLLDCGSGSCVGDTCLCEMGYHFDNITVTCIDDNECNNDNSTFCPINSVCINSEGSFFCICYEGFEMKNGDCIDVNECSVPDLCGIGGFCENHSGSYTCSCLSGHILIGGICQELNECDSNKGKETCLSVNAECVDAVSGFVCRCRPGFYMNNEFCIPAKTTLSGQLTLSMDFDMFMYTENSPIFRKLSFELETLLSILVASELGQVHILSFRPGSTIVNYVVMTQSIINYEDFNNRLIGSCQPYSAKPDSCLLSNNIAVQNLTDLHTSAKYFNACAAQYVHDYCPTFMAHCINLENGQYQCICKSGFRMIATSNNIPLCVDIDECNETIDPCYHNQICHNSFGSYSCDCIEGFYQNENKDCLLLCVPNPCKNNGKCEITRKNEYMCKCQVNYLGDHCELPNKPLLEATNLLYIVSGVLTIMLIISILLGTICFKKLQKNSKVEVDRVSQLFSKYYDNEAVN